MAIAPTAVLTGYLGEAAIRSQDRRAVAVTGAATLALTATGAAAMPRSGFPIGVGVGAWMIYRAHQLGRV